MKVAAILRVRGDDVVTTRPETPLHEALRVMRDRAIGALVVTDGAGAVVGLLSERDVVVGLATHGARAFDLRVSQLMARPAVTCEPDDSLKSVMALMTRQRVRQVPVVEPGGKLAGIVSVGDVVRHRLDELQMETNLLREGFMARQQLSQH
jgi:CBS domain-containing protein